MTELPYKRDGPFDTVIRNGLEHILDPNGKIWPWHWKNKGDKTGNEIAFEKKLEEVKATAAAADDKCAFKKELEELKGTVWKVVDSDDDDECKRKNCKKYFGKCIDCTMYCGRCGGTGGHCSCTDSSDDDSN